MGAKALNWSGVAAAADFMEEDEDNADLADFPDPPIVDDEEDEEMEEEEEVGGSNFLLFAPTRGVVGPSPISPTKLVPPSPPAPGVTAADDDDVDPLFTIPRVLYR